MVVMEPEPEVAEEENQEEAVTGSGGQSGAPPEASVVAPGDAAGGSENISCEDALTDEQQRERALNQANRAKEEGNKLFRAGEYEEALSQYEHALQIASKVPSSTKVCSTSHANRAVCFLKLGKYNDTIKECSKALELNPSYVKALIRRGEAHGKLENFEEAIADMKRIIELDPSNDQAGRNIYKMIRAIGGREARKDEGRNDREVEGDGDSILGRFGMNVDNFKAVKDPNSGSYSISFQR